MWTLCSRPLDAFWNVNLEKLQSPALMYQLCGGTCCQRQYDLPLFLRRARTDGSLSSESAGIARSKYRLRISIFTSDWQPSSHATKFWMNPSRYLAFVPAAGASSYASPGATSFGYSSFLFPMSQNRITVNWRNGLWRPEARFIGWVQSKRAV